MTPEDVVVVQRSWTRLVAQREAFAARLGAALAVQRGMAIGPPHAARLLAIADELIPLLATPSALAARVGALVSTWPPGAPAPSVEVDADTWALVARDLLATWTPHDEVAWRRAWVLLVDVLAADCLAPFPGPAPDVRSARRARCVAAPDAGVDPPGAPS
jgi:hypothetical protein